MAGISTPNFVLQKKNHTIFAICRSKNKIKFKNLGVKKLQHPLMKKLLSPNIILKFGFSIERIYFSLSGLTKLDVFLKNQIFTSSLFINELKTGHKASGTLIIEIIRQSSIQVRFLRYCMSKVT